MQPHKRILADMESLCLQAARDLVHLIRQGVDARDEFHLFLAGGSTPKSLYKLLATEPYSSSIPWGKVHLYFGDERNVAPDHPDSNFNMVNTALLGKVNIDPTHIHRIRGELDATEAASTYDTLLKNILPKDSDERLQPDLVLLGLGGDGHVASLFPGSAILDEADASCAATPVEKLKTWRISITYPLINNARDVWLFVAGDSKRAIVDRIFNHPSSSEPLPVERINARGRLTWYLDQAAASQLT